MEASLGYNSDTAINTRLRLRNQDVFGTAWRFNSELRYDEKVQSMRADLDAPPRTDGSWNNHFAALQEADIRKRLQELGALPVGSTPEEFAAHIKADRNGGEQSLARTARRLAHCDACAQHGGCGVAAQRGE